jgi:hypothetical protein
VHSTYSKKISTEDSSRTQFIKKKFHLFEPDEKVLDSFACATMPADTKLLLQGRLYITDRACYFYSPFNHKTLLGQGSKLRLAYSDIENIRKESTLVFFATSIRFFFKSGEQILL